MSDFGDYDPEDEWDDGDTAEAKLDVLQRVVLTLERRYDESRRNDALRLLGKLEASLRQPPSRKRLQSQALHIERLRARLEAFG